MRGAIGVEYRRAEIDDTPSIDSQNGNLYNLTSAAITRGKDSVWELYGEVEVPLLRGLPGAEELTVNLSGRYTDYKSYGSDTTYKIGALYSPVRAADVPRRAGHLVSRPGAVRAVRRRDQRLPEQPGRPLQQLWRARPDLDPRAQLRERGPAARTSRRRAASRASRSAATEAGLKAETSKNKTIGVIIQPELPTGWGDFSFAVDYYDIEVDNGVDRVGTGNILSLCYDHAELQLPVLPARLARARRAPTGRSRSTTAT